MGKEASSVKIPDYEESVMNDLTRRDLESEPTPSGPQNLEGCEEINGK